MGLYRSLGATDVTRRLSGEPAEHIRETKRRVAAGTLGAINPAAGDNARQLGEAVADAIVNAVAQGLLQPGERIVEADLASQFNLSRVPIREAIKILQAQGILNVTPNRGARVALFEPRVIDQVFEVRIALERIAVRDAAKTYGQDPRQIDVLREVVLCMQRAAHWQDWVEFRKCDVDFHHEICRASGNEIVLKLWEAIARHITIIFGRELASERNFELVIEQHLWLIALFAESDPALEDVIENHITRLRKVESAPTIPAARPRKRGRGS